MPKKKVDSLQGFRIEIQEKERQMLGFYTMSAGIRNVGVGVGSILKPLADNFAVLIAGTSARRPSS